MIESSKLEVGGIEFRGRMLLKKVLTSYYIFYFIVSTRQVLSVLSISLYYLAVSRCLAYHKLVALFQISLSGDSMYRGKLCDINTNFDEWRVEQSDQISLLCLYLIFLLDITKKYIHKFSITS